MSNTLSRKARQQHRRLKFGHTYYYNIAKEVVAPYRSLGTNVKDRELAAAKAINRLLNAFEWRISPARRTVIHYICKLLNVHYRNVEQQRQMIALGKAGVKI